jgi:DNA-binding NarL/FixJ family response regulator
MPSKTKILIVDDHPMMREGLTQLISREKDLAICGEAEDAHQAMELLEKQRPHLVLADITMPKKSGLEMLKDIHAGHPDVRVLVISMHDESLYAERVLRAGARGYIMKQEGGKKIMEAIRRVLGGQIYVSEKMGAKLLEIFSNKGKGSESSPLEKLTDREFEVFQLIGQGLSTREISQKLHLSVKTVEVHRNNAKQKLELRSSADLLRYAVRWTESQHPG